MNVIHCLFTLMLFLSGVLSAKVPEYYKYYDLLEKEGKAILLEEFKIRSDSPEWKLIQGKQALMSADYDSVKIYAKQVLTVLKFPALQLISDAYLYQSSNDSAAAYAFRMMNLAEQQADKELIALSHLQLAKLYYYIHAATERQLAFEHSALSLKSSDWHEIKALNCHLLGAMYSELKKADSSMYFLQQCIEIRMKNGTDFRLSKVYTLLGFEYSKLGRFDKALNQFKLAYSTAKKFGQKSAEELALTNLGELYSKTGNQKKALEYYLLAYSMADSAKTPERLYNITLHIAGLYYELGDYKNASDYFNKAIVHKTETMGEKLPKEMAKMKIAYETEKKERENALLKAENELQKSEQRRLEHQFFSFAVIVLLLLLILIAVFYFYSRWKNLQLQQGALHALLEGEQQERTRIARELHDNVGQYLSALNMNLSVLEEDLKNEEDRNLAQKALQINSDAIDAVRSLSHLLLPEELSKFELKRALGEILKQYSHLKKPAIELNADIAEDLLSAEQRIALFRIIQEFLSNSVKHSGAERISVNLSEKSGMLLLEIKDNGKGMSAESLKKSNGLGRKNIEARAMLLKAALEWDSAAGKGTALTLSIPYSGTKK
jgi:two-component system, NarL family, sensor kinase